VTGAAGFIGSNLVERLLADGHMVRGLDNFFTGKRENIDAAVGESGAERFELFTGDIRSSEVTEAAMQGVDYVLHEAAIPSVQRSVDDPIASNDVNICGILNLLVAARDAGVKRFVYAASSSAYGDSPTLPKVETMPTKPLSPYAITKLVGEQYCRVFHEIYGLETVALRYFNVFGKRQDPTSHYSAVIPKFISALLENRPPTIHGDGEQSRDFTFIDNVVNANLLACKASDAPGKVFNIACGERFTLNQLLEILADLVGSGVDAVHEDPRQGDVRHSLADITLAKDVLGFNPSIGFKDGLERTLEFFKEG